METRAQCPFPKLNLAIAVKQHAQIDIKLFLSCPVFLAFSILFGTPAPRRHCLVNKKFIVMSEKGVCRHGIKTDRHITYSIFCIPNTNSEIYIRSHFLCLVKFVDISYVTHLAPLRFTNFERCRFQNFLFPRCLWLDLLGIVKDVEQHRRFSVQ